MAFGKWRQQPRQSHRRTLVHAINPHGYVGSGRATSPSGRPATHGSVDAVATAAPPPPPRAARQFSATAVLPLLSSAVESAAEVAVFEQLAGRSAMIGLTAALILECATSGPTFATLSPEAAAAAAAAAVGSVAAAAIAAAAAARAPPRATDADAAAAAAAAAAASAAAPRAWWWLGAGIHEAVVSSLTSTRGSASGVTQVNVDQAVDFVVDRCLTRSVHPVFGPLDDLTDAGATVATVVDALLRGDGRPDLLQ